MSRGVGETGCGPERNMVRFGLICVMVTPLGSFGGVLRDSLIC